jgi:(p)ppGpp synthase/HD superfamily hydrolase
MSNIIMEDTNFWGTKFEPCGYSSRLLDKLYGINAQAKKEVNLSEIKKAIYYAKKYHGEQKRQSGEPYYSHPIEVAYMISDYLFRTDIIVTSILHDTIEDTDLTFGMITSIFGEVVASQVMDLTRIKEDSRKISSAEMVELLFKQKKYDVLLIKLLDRLHNMQTISAKSSEKQRKIIDETLKCFLILSEIMELPKLSDALYNQCYQTSIRLGLVKNNDPIFDRQSSFLSIPTSGNKIH